MAAGIWASTTSVASVSFVEGSLQFRRSKQERPRMDTVFLVQSPPNDSARCRSSGAFCFVDAVSSTGPSRRDSTSVNGTRVSLIPVIPIPIPMQESDGRVSDEWGRGRRPHFLSGRAERNVALVSNRRLRGGGATWHSFACSSLPDRKRICHLERSEFVQANRVDTWTKCDLINGSRGSGAAGLGAEYWKVTQGDRTRGRCWVGVGDGGEEMSVWGLDASSSSSFSSSSVGERAEDSYEEEESKVRDGTEETGAGNEPAMVESQARLERLEVLLLLSRLYRDVVRSDWALSNPIPEVAVEDEGREESRGRRVRGGGLESRGRLGKMADDHVYVTSAVEILDYADDVRELASNLVRDLQSVDGLLPVVFKEDAQAETLLTEKVEKIVERLEQLASAVDASLSPEDMERAKQERDAVNEQDDNVKSRVLRRLEKLSDTSAVLDGVLERIARVDLKNVRLDILQTRLRQLFRGLADTWRRLNGLQPASAKMGVLVSSLPRPGGIRARIEEKKLALILEVEALEKRLKEVSRAREDSLRRKNALERTRLANQIRVLDDEVDELRKKLAVRTLQLEMELIYPCLEEEVRQISADIRSDEEESLLIAEFGMLDADLAKLRVSVDRNEAILIEDLELAQLAIDIPDFKNRLGIQEQAVIPFGQRAQLALEEGTVKIKEGCSFYWRGLRLLAGDLLYAGRVFVAAVGGTTLNPREAATLRRTATDVLTLVPFTIILITPLTPVGHVLVFSFIQRYFPGFFPSSFTNKRQDVMQRYEALREQIASAATESERDEVRAMAEVAAVETFEASEEEEAGQKGVNDRIDAARRIELIRARRGPGRLLLLPERLPGLSKGGGINGLGGGQIQPTTRGFNERKEASTGSVTVGQDGAQ